MSEQSLSVSHGPVAGRRHDVDVEYRIGLANVRPELTCENQVLVDDDLAQVYGELFGGALEAYNARQAAKGHPERQIADYLEHVRSDGKLEPARELVVQVGNMATNPSGDKTCRMLSSLIYREWLGEFERRFPHLRVYQAAIHVDEATPHMHVAYIPWVDGRKRGLETQNSLSGAYRADGFEDVRDANAEMFRMLEDVAARHGVERVWQGCTRAHMSVRDFKQVVREAGAGSYPWCNDPRLVALVQDQLEAQQAADELLEMGVKVIDDLADALDGTRPLSKESREAAAEEARGFAARLDAMLGARRRDAQARRRFLDMLERLKDWRHWLINPVSEAMRRSRERFASDTERVGSWRDRVADAMDGFRRTWQPTDLRCGVPDRAEGPAVRELTAEELLSADLAAPVEDRPEQFRGPCVAGDGLSWFAYTGGDLPAVGTFATREAAVAFALAGGGLGVEEAADLRASLAEADRARARGPEGGLDEPPDPSPGDEEELAARL